jgi:hypothetical protein
MLTPRETILAALHALLRTLPATPLRGAVLPERVPSTGILILRDGEPGEPKMMLSSDAGFTTGSRRRCRAGRRSSQPQGGRHPSTADSVVIDGFSTSCSSCARTDRTRARCRWRSLPL